MLIYMKAPDEFYVVMMSASSGSFGSALGEGTTLISVTCAEADW